MKKMKLTALALTSASLLCAAPAFANGLSKVSAKDVANFETCLNAAPSSRTIRACTKALKASAPDQELRSNLYAKRGLHQLAQGEYERAAKDFRRAGALSDQNDFARLGEGFAAMMKADLTTARAHFEDCGSDADTAPLAQYGLGLTHEMAGQTDAARAAYGKALSLKPGWTAPQTQMDKLGA